MKNCKGITLVMLIITIIVMMLLVGAVTFTVGDTLEDSRNLKFVSYMKMIQKKVDVYVEEGTPYTNLGQPLSASNKSRLQEILDADTDNLIDTSNANSDKIRYFNGNDIYLYFDIPDIGDEIVVNFENREVISLIGVKKDHKSYYVERGL